MTNGNHGKVDLRIVVVSDVMSDIPAIADCYSLLILVLQPLTNREDAKCSRDVEQRPLYLYR